MIHSLMYHFYKSQCYLMQLKFASNSADNDVLFGILLMESWQ